MSKKLTKKEMLVQILSHTTDEAEREFLKNEIELLERKANNKKPTKEQEENAGLKALILEVAVEPMTVSEIWRTNPDWVEKWSVQKFSALVNQLETEGKIERIMEKRVAKFKAIVVEVEEDEGE